MKIYNTLTNNIESFTPHEEGKVNMYICGHTVNKRTHLGHMYPVIFFDTVYRYFKYLGYEVNYVSNFTDVDDKIIASAKEEGVLEKDIADRYAKYYLEDIKKLNCLDISKRPKVTEYIPQIIAFINKLLESGHAYKAKDDVYFSIDSIKDYGKLSNQKLEELNAGSRIEVSVDKKNPYDFALWKKTLDGIKWDAPFGTGRPGWHTECVVMVNEIFGDKLDIHGGGIDLKFPHHENEIAQANAAYGNDIASIWMHNGHLMLDGIKMSKSLGNVLMLDDLLENYNANIIRIAILKNHYRLPLSLTDDSYLESKTIDDKICNVLKQANLYIQINDLKLNEINKDEKVEELMNDDFNTSNLITYMLDLVKLLNNSLREKNNTEISHLYDRLYIVINILGLKYDLIKLNDEDKKLYQEWLNYRELKNFEKADELREILVTKNII